MFSVEALNVLLFLIPGLYVVLFVDTFSIRKRQPTALDKFAESLVFSLFIYGIYPQSHKDFSGIALDKSLIIPFGEGAKLLMLLVVSTSIALTVTYAKRWDVHMRVMRWAKATKLTSRKTTWQEAFDAYERNVFIELEDGRTFAGYPQFLFRP